MNAIPSKGDALSVWNFVGDSDMNFLFKIFAHFTIAPLVLIIYLVNFGSSYLRIDLLYGVSVCFIGPKFINFIYLDIVQEFINVFNKIIS